MQPRGSMIYSPTDGFVYISDGVNWDRISGVNNPVDILLPVTQHRMAKWSEEFPPGAAYTSPVLQDSSFEVDDDGNSILNDTGNTPDTFPWNNANFMTHGSVVTSYTYGTSLDPSDPTSFTPILTQLKGDSPGGEGAGREPITPGRRLKERYDDGTVAIGHEALEDIVYSSSDSFSTRNVVVGVKAGKHLSADAMDNVGIGHGALQGFPGISSLSVQGLNNVAIGSNAMIRTTTASDCVLVGANTSTGATSLDTVVVGSKAKATANGSIVVGARSNDAGFNGVVILGSGVTAKGDNRLVLGSGIEIIKAVPDMVEPGSSTNQECLTIQIGAHSYLLPLLRLKS